ncbi:MAG: hypothetical protein CMJ83_17180 [Planctomycetes bacterium]|nr:hypothetical protein [Planctomycetota bacterium]
MRIVSVTTSFPRHGDDHAGRFVHDLHAGLCEQGHDVLTLCPEAPGVAPSETTEAGEVRRVAYAGRGTADLFYGDGLEENVRRTRGPWRKLRRFLREAEAVVAQDRGVDVLLAHWLWPSGRALLRAAREGRPLLGVAHGGDVHYLGRPALGSFLARGLRGAYRGVLCTSSVGSDIVRRRLAIDNVDVAPMGVDPARFHPDPGRAPPAGFPSEYVLGVGRLLPIKGFDVLIRAAAGLELPVVLAGTGPSADDWRRVAHELDVELHLVGHLGPDAVAAAMQAARAVVVPSRPLQNGRVEGCPVVAVEALAVGKPVLASRTGGLPDLLPDAVLFRPADSEALRDLLRRVVEGTLEMPTPRGPLTRRETALRLLALL